MLRKKQDSTQKHKKFRTRAKEVNTSMLKCSTCMHHQTDQTANPPQRHATEDTSKRTEGHMREGFSRCMGHLPPGPIHQWVMGTIATVAFRRLAGLSTSKHNQSYNTTLQFIRCKISVSLIDTATMCLCKLRSSFHTPANKFNFCHHPLDLIRREVQLGN